MARARLQLDGSVYTYDSGSGTWSDEAGTVIDSAVIGRLDAKSATSRAFKASLYPVFSSMRPEPKAKKAKAGASVSGKGRRRAS